MSNQDELQEVADVLTGGDHERRARLLKILSRNPFGDERILPYVEKCLEDLTPCLVMIPYRYAEIRYLAARALVSERKALGLEKYGRTIEVVQPVDNSELSSLKKRYGIKSSTGKRPPERQLDSFSKLNELNVLPKMKLEI